MAGHNTVTRDLDDNVAGRDVKYMKTGKVRDKHPQYYRGSGGGSITAQGIGAWYGGGRRFWSKTVSECDGGTLTQHIRNALVFHNECLFIL